MATRKCQVVFLTLILLLVQTAVPPPLEAAPFKQGLQHIQQCTQYILQENSALENKQWQQLVTTGRLNLTECQDRMDLEGETGTLADIAIGLNRLGNFTDALPISKRCVLLKPDDTECYVSMGESYEGLSSLKEALDAYNEAINIGGYDFWTAFGIGLAKSRVPAIKALLDAENRPLPEPQARIEGTGFFVADKGDFLSTWNSITNLPEWKSLSASRQAQVKNLYYPDVEANGYILTNNHVISECNEFHTSDGAPLALIDFDADSDLALLKSNLAPPAVATFRTGASPRLGDQVIAFGFPLAGLLSSGGNLSVGVVAGMSGVGDDQKMFQISTPVQPGNSGGPLFDDSGSVIGVVVAQLDAVKMAEATGDIPQNVNFAIRASEVIRFLDKNSIPYRRRITAIPMKTPDIAALAKRIAIQIECTSRLDSTAMTGVLGKLVSDSSVQEFMRNLNEGSDPKPLPAFVDPAGKEWKTYNFQKIGVGLTFGDNRAATLTLQRGHDQEEFKDSSGAIIWVIPKFDSFRGILPMGLSWVETRTEILSRVGQPQSSDYTSGPCTKENIVGCLHIRTDVYREGDFEYTLNYNNAGELLRIDIDLNLP